MPAIDFLSVGNLDSLTGKLIAAATIAPSLPDARRFLGLSVAFTGYKPTLGFV